MIDYKLFSFACPPSVGGEWFLHAAELCGLGKAELKQAYAPFDGDRSNQLDVMLVRNPCMWIVDCYNQLHSDIGIGIITSENNAPRLLTALDGSLSIDSFVGEYVRKAPGAFGRIVSRYEADTVLRIEDMPWAMIELLDALGVPKYMRDRVVSFGRPKLENGKPLPPPLARMVANMERELMERYDYFV